MDPQTVADFWPPNRPEVSKGFGQELVRKPQISLLWVVVFTHVQTLL